MTVIASLKLPKGNYKQCITNDRYQQKGSMNSKKLYEAEFGIELEQEDLERKARTLFNLCRAMYSSAADAVGEVQLTED